MLGISWVQGALAEGCETPPLHAVPSSCSVSDSEGKMVVREIATRPLTQDLLSHEVRGSGRPQRPAPCPLSPEARTMPGGWDRAQHSTASTARLSPGVFLSHL